MWVFYFDFCFLDNLIVGGELGFEPRRLRLKH